MARPPLDSYASTVVPDVTSTAPHSPGTHPPGLAHHFESFEQQREASELGMWLFLVTEFMFFGGFLLGYLTYRYWYPDEFIRGSQSMNVVLGTINTAVLLTSSFTMALAVHAVHEANRRRLTGMLIATMTLGGVFLAIKAYEYHHKYAEHLIPFGGLRFAPEGGASPGLKAFYNLYFLLTGLHAFHMVIGLGILGTLVIMSQRGKLLNPHSMIVHNAGLYWHFVDLVWVYLFPFFYLIAAASHRAGG